MSATAARYAQTPITRTLSITSGKGGVGKSTLVANLALALARRDRRVLLLDGDFGMANLDIMFGVRPQQNIASVLRGDKKLSDVIVEVAPRIHLVPGGSGVYGLSDIRQEQKLVLLDQVNELEGLYDYLLIDTAPGISEHVLYLNSAAQEILLILTPEPASLTDAYALIKVMHVRQRERRFSVVANMVRDDREGRMVFSRLADVVGQFLNVSLEFRGTIPFDGTLRQATKMQQMLLKIQNSAPAAVAMQKLAMATDGGPVCDQIKGGLQFFWEQMVGLA